MDVEYFRWMLPPDAWCKRPHKSRWDMTREDAERNYPGATPILATRNVRSLPTRNDPAWFGATSQPMPEAQHGKSCTATSNRLLPAHRTGSRLPSGSA